MLGALYLTGTMILAGAVLGDRKQSWSIVLPAWLWTSFVAALASVPAVVLFAMAALVGVQGDSIADGIVLVLLMLAVVISWGLGALAGLASCNLPAAPRIPMVVLATLIVVPAVLLAMLDPLGLLVFLLSPVTLGFLSVALVVVTAPCGRE
ncbi:MAG: hypothetical protein AB7K24_33755 [Gemmataceae bacterium]